jgi:hypothetical protein
MATQKTAVTRTRFKSMLAANPNLFGHFPNLGITAKYKPEINTTYEELGCVSYHPATEQLRAVIKLKQPSGYGGDVCSDGSLEYVRFFVDYNNNGNWVDEGLSVTNVHSLNFKEELCYAVNLRITPDVKHLCNGKPVLPKVRAILSWNQEPTAGNPNFQPHWGDIKEVYVQIAPWKFKFPFITIPKTIKNIGKIALAKATPVPVEAAELFESVSLSTLMKEYGQKVETNRSGFSAVKALMKENKTINPKLTTSLSKLKLNIESIVDFINTSKFKTNYEELTCVGLNREQNELHGVIHIKNPYGYMGNLCAQGSREFIAFYMDFGAGWEYMGTTSVRVHDIPEIPKSGLWYNAFLPVDLTPHQKAGCVAGKAKVRGILSWNVAPTPNDPNYVAPWGDWEECVVEVKPLPKGFDPKFPKPLLESVGGIQISAIDSNGIADGQSTFIPAIHANDSRFDGEIVFAGLLPFAPENEPYEIHIQYPGQLNFVPYTAPFHITVSSWNAMLGTYTQSTILQTPVGNQFLYRCNSNPFAFKSVVGNILGKFITNQAGKHAVKIVRPLVLDPALRESETVYFAVEKSVVDVELTLNVPATFSPEAGCEDCQCGDFVAGDLITGTFSWSGEDFNAVSLSIAPACSHNQQPDFVQMLGDGNPGNDNVILYNPANGNLQITNNTWQLDTTGMCRCGYTVHIHGSNRTIMNSSYIGKRDSDAVGFCLRKATK